MGDRKAEKKGCGTCIFAAKDGACRLGEQEEAKCKANKYSEYL